MLLKEVPDTYGDRDLNLETGLTDRSGDVVADEVCERAVEAAMRLKEARGDEETTVDLFTVGPPAYAKASPWAPTTPTSLPTTRCSART